MRSQATVIVVEGPDGSGKTTHSRLLAETLRSRLAGEGYVVTHCEHVIEKTFPGQCQLSCALQRAERFAPMKGHGKGDVFVFDRWAWSNYAYGHRELCRWEVREFLPPTLTFVLHCNPSELHRRLTLRGGSSVESVPELRKLESAYADCAVEFDGQHGNVFHGISSESSKSTVASLLASSSMSWVRGRGPL